MQLFSRKHQYLLPETQTRQKRT